MVRAGARPCLDEDLLQDFLGIVTAFQNSKNQAVEKSVVRIVQLAQRGWVAGDDPIQQGDIGMHPIGRSQVEGQGPDFNVLPQPIQNHCLHVEIYV